MSNLAHARERLRLYDAALAACETLESTAPDDFALLVAKLVTRLETRKNAKRARDSLGAILDEASDLTAKRKTTRVTYRDMVIRVLVGANEPMGSSAIADRVEAMVPGTNGVSVQAEVNRMLKEKPPLVAKSGKIATGFAAYTLTANGKRLAAERNITKGATK